VLERRGGLLLSRAEVHVAVAGGVRVREPGVDLAVALAVASSLVERPLPAGLVACGEVGLGGELRQVHRTDRRLSEAARLGFARALVPASAPDPPDGLRLDRVRSLHEALVAAGLVQVG
jgi:DNA repair protein RadA/Sms